MPVVHLCSFSSHRRTILTLYIAIGQHWQAKLGLSLSCRLLALLVPPEY